MAELRDIKPKGRVDFHKDMETCYFKDGSALMMVFDESLCPIDFLVISPPGHEEAFTHALSCINACDGWCEETLSHNIESNFPELDLDECDDMANMAIDYFNKQKH